MSVLGPAFRLVAVGWRSILALAILISVGCFVFSLALADVFTQAAVLRGGRTLRALDAVSFTTFYKEGGVSTPDAAALDLVERQLASRVAYTAVVQNADLDGTASVTDVPIVVIFGDIIPDLYPDLRLCSPAPCAMRGVDVKVGVPPDLTYAGMRIPFADELPRRATWFDPNSTGIKLAERIVVRLPPQDVSRLDQYAQEELLSRVVMLAPPGEVVDDFVGAVRSSDLYLVPSRLAQDQPRGFRQVLSRSALYLAGFLAYLGLMFGVLSASLHSLLRREATTFWIYRMSGASTRQVNGSIAVFLAFSTVLLPVLACAPLLLVGESFADAFGVVLVGCAAVWLLETVRARRSLAGSEVGGD